MTTASLNDAVRSQIVEGTLAGVGLHDEWVRAFRTQKNEAFFELAFDYVSTFLARAPKARILDAGCGTCNHSLRLARRGFSVTGVDVSPAALEKAADRVAQEGLANRITLEPGNITSLPFADGSFQHVLCWGVLMHIPDVEQAVSELARVLAPGGLLFLGENNARSISSLLLRHVSCRFWKKHQYQSIVKTPAGVEHWWNSSAGNVMVRHVDAKWLRRTCRTMGLMLEKRVARQFTEAYLRYSSPTALGAIHRFNNAWFKYVGLPQPALGNLFIFRKP